MRGADPEHAATELEDAVQHRGDLCLVRGHVHPAADHSRQAAVTDTELARSRAGRDPAQVLVDLVQCVLDGGAPGDVGQYRSC